MRHEYRHHGEGDALVLILAMSLNGRRVNPAFQK
jgi:hypothetical protein